MPGNQTQQQRAGYNQGIQSLPLSDAKFLGQPAVKIGTGDTVIFRNSPVVPGESNPRGIMNSPVGVAGYVFNRSGSPAQIDFVLIDDQGNQWLANPGAPLGIPDGGQVPIQFLMFYLATSGITLPTGWSIAVRLIAGDPSGGQGIVAWPWAHDRTRNMVAIMEALTTSVLEFGPPKGRAWQICGSASAGIAGCPLLYVNFDSVDRTVTDEIFHLASEDIKVNSGVVPVTEHVAIESGVEKGFLDLPKDKGIIIAYPDTIKLKAGENQTSAPLYVFANFAEFDLPRDMG